MEIYADVLHVVRSLPNSPMTRISYGANLPLDRAKNILKVLVQCDLIRLEVSDSSRLYRITSRGVEFLETYKRMKGFLSILGEDSPEKKHTNDM